MKKLSYFLYFIIIISLFLILYVFPSMKTINKFKRETKDYKLKIEDIKKKRSLFTELDKREFFHISRIKKEIRKKVPVIRDSNSLIQLKKETSTPMKKLAGKMKIGEIRITPVNDKKVKRNTILTLPGAEDLRTLNCSLFFLSSLKKGLTFINKLSWLEKNILIYQIKITPGNNGLLFSIITKCFYFDNTRKWKVKNREGREGLIDLNSPILEKKIYYNLPERAVKENLPKIYGKRLFR
ncbi:MAG: hypothetical protein ABFR75_14000 [Acidobacteriota bacterium]